MSLNNFIPEIWSNEILLSLKKTLVFAQAGVVNRNWEGEIRQKGDTVRINSIGPVSVSNYTKDTDISAPETLTDAQQTLVIDQQKYFNFSVDDVDKIQGNVSVMGDAVQEAAYALANTIDQFVAGKYTDVASANAYGSQGSPKSITASSDAYEHLVALSVLLDEANVPPEGRYVIVPPWYHGVLLKDDRFVKFGTPPQDARLRNAIVGATAGFEVVKSNNCVNPTGAVWVIQAGHSMAQTFAEQAREVVGYRPERRFSDAIKGLTLYGAKTVRPDAIAVMHVTRP